MEETPESRIERLVSQGQMPGDQVNEALRFWDERLRDGTLLPNGERVFVSLTDLYHLIVDARIWRRPERIESLLVSVFEFHALDHGRRLGLSRWQEPEGLRWGMVIIDPDRSVRTLHIIDERRVRRYQRIYGEVIWRSSE